MVCFKVQESSLQLGWSGWGLAFCRCKVKKWGGGLYKITNKGQIRPCILYKIQASNPIFFSPRALVVPSFWRYKIKTLGRILTNWQCLTPVCWHGCVCVPRKTTFGFCKLDGGVFESFCIPFRPYIYLHRICTPSVNALFIYHWMT